MCHGVGFEWFHRTYQTHTTDASCAVLELEIMVQFIHKTIEGYPALRGVDWEMQLRWEKETLSRATRDSPHNGRMRNKLASNALHDEKLLNSAVKQPLGSSPNGNATARCVKRAIYGRKSANIATRDTAPQLSLGM